MPGLGEAQSLYPSGPRLVARFKKKLVPYGWSTGTIRFPLTGVPVKLIEGIAKFRAKEVAARARAKRRSSEGG